MVCAFSLICCAFFLVDLGWYFDFWFSLKAPSSGKNSQGGWTGLWFCFSACFLWETGLFFFFFPFAKNKAQEYFPRLPPQPGSALETNWLHPTSVLLILARSLSQLEQSPRSDLYDSMISVKDCSSIIVRYTGGTVPMEPCICSRGSLVCSRARWRRAAVLSTVGFFA